MSPPVLYSLRLCPYAMRARLALLLAQQPVMLRCITMRNIPNAMLAVSAKRTVPLLVFDNSSVIDESLEIMIWALNQHDPDNLLLIDQPAALATMHRLIKRNDNEFVESLEKYKVAARYHDIAEIFYRQQCERFITHLEQCLTEHEFLMGISASLADYALLPFIRQFSRVDRRWYLQAPYPNLRRWLTIHYQNPFYAKALSKYPLWLEQRQDILFSG